MSRLGRGIFSAALLAALVSLDCDLARAREAEAQRLDRLDFLERWLYLLLHNLNRPSPSRDYPPEILLYDEVVEQEHGKPLQIGRVVQLMLFIDQVTIHHRDRHELDGVLVLRRDGAKVYVGVEELRRLARILGQAPALGEAQLASMIKSIYINRSSEAPVRQIEQWCSDPVEAAAELLFIDRADGSLDGHLSAPNQAALAGIFHQYGTSPVIPFSGKRGAESWVTARQFIKPSEVQVVLQRASLKPGKGSESKIVRALVKELTRELHPILDPPDLTDIADTNDAWFYPNETLERHGGDCEDLSFLIQSCLEALQIPSHLVFGSVWDEKRQIWLGHVWVEWQQQILDLAYRTNPRSAICRKRSRNSPYRGFIWFDSQHLGMVADWQRNRDTSNPFDSVTVAQAQRPPKKRFFLFRVVGQVPSLLGFRKDTDDNW